MVVNADDYYEVIKVKGVVLFVERFVILFEKELVHHQKKVILVLVVQDVLRFAVRDAILPVEGIPAVQGVIHIDKSTLIIQLQEILVVQEEEEAVLVISNQEGILASFIVVVVVLFLFLQEDEIVYLPRVLFRHNEKEHHSGSVFLLLPSFWTFEP